MSLARAGLRTLRSLPSRQVNRATSVLAQRRWLSEEARRQIDSHVKEADVVVFMKGTPDHPECGFSRAVAQILDVQGVPREKMKTFNILQDAELRTNIKEYSEWPTIPQVYVKGEFVGGADIMYSMHKDGSLEKMLVKEEIIEELPELTEEPTQ
ncbi:thioredoxin-like protein [Kockovaella imperatae]|uniref:Monothiol glutaredoxin-5, mitochondrial n=1 Tax=Kockovaella imperatae TaxID=4999 RepID=A0A1Y1U6Y4_9TREE|nr:thioredoxin-like protein [Kockovaella imperatae]ORX33790.1 thioredoxin-like protein [Kockovaella imperatae]